MVHTDLELAICSQDGLKLSNLLASVVGVLESEVCARAPGSQRPSSYSSLLSGFLLALLLRETCPGPAVWGHRHVALLHSPDTDGTAVSEAG